MLLWGEKSVAMFDVWSIEHFVTGINAYFVCSHPRARRIFSVVGGLVAGCYAWEALEHYLELGLAGPAVKYWFHGVEHPMNRLVGDPLVLFFGAFVAHGRAYLSLPAKIFSATWLFIHIVIFPHSMVLQAYL